MSNNHIVAHIAEYEIEVGDNYPKMSTNWDGG